MYRGREKRMNESALEGFVKIVEMNSFSAAAEALYLSQSALSQQIRTLELQMKHAEGEKLETMLNTYSRLNHEFELLNGYAWQSEITGVLKGLGFVEEEFSKPVSELSGGQKTRVSLGKLLLSKPDIILLDEPTNHLDMESIAWLETYLMNYAGTVIIVAHDRYFLDRVVTKIVELDGGIATSFQGNYTAYSEKKAIIRAGVLKAYLNQQQEIRHQEEVITKLKSFNREKSIKRAESREKMLSKMDLLEKPTEINDAMHITLEPCVTSGNDVLSVRELAKSFDGMTLFTDLNFEIKRGERIAIIGNNGTGKTTILKMINGLLTPDNGEIRLGSKVHIGYYDQEHQVLHMDKTLFDELQDTYPDMNNTQIRNVLAAFLFTGDDVFKRIRDLSGGERGPVSLAKLMLSEANFLILDEPTNHLDIASISWLETYLRSYKGAVLIVSHDRYFLDRVVTKVIAIENGLVRSYAGNYSDYAAKAAMLRKAAVNAYLKQQEEIHHQQQVIDKLKSFNREKSIKRAESREKMLDKMELLEKPVEIRDDMHLKLTPQIISGNDVLSIEDLSKHFGSLTLFEHVDIEIKRGEHVAIIGDNGTGKTTLLKIINELESMDSGQIRLGSKVEIGYYDQEHHVLHSEKTLFDEISDDYPALTNTQIRNTLAAFLFTGDDVFKKISELSGGERGRVSLAKLMLSNANFLILDEPTNHLDITSKEILEQALNDYEGTVLYVSHDRYFVNQTATRILDLYNKQFYSFAGNYDYYLEKKDVVEQPSGAVQPNSQTTTAGANTDAAESASDSKLSWQQQKEEQALKRKKENRLRKCEDDIAALEDEIAQLNEQMTDPAIATDVAKLQELSKKQTALQKTLEQRYEEWEELSE